ncbi:MAG: Rieske 2Fe-2S domain-containing protein [Rhodospirillaceae bacterium]|nr:Rieske 2Fe-2S domain-containing protein [Rhodospirillaceae bacterium]MBT3886078.1 Rieske 2Fe-2S domain-containing protein [Rhodospirillaceae bacterium]MBT4116761.1 Rieske 2Fe-2S domain-containing protein [Rhodospirillaceae bacterium]MBT4719126.1 Rieske 2Fe-2S domain-containing protein [Rhodospirillaceae bacterium]MBT4748802.1 Rieske 2Fe-2S domain-containing protein [Rhodospirillaceae bacterium]
MSTVRPTGLDIQWPTDDSTRVPYEVFSDADIYEVELTKIFSGAHWTYLALSQEIPEPGDFTTTYVGERCVVVNRGEGGEVNAFENRCAHRGARVVPRLRGNAKQFNCPYHMWCYDHGGKLKAVPQQTGVKGKGGMPADFELSNHNLTSLKTETYKGMIFGTFADEIMPLTEYLGPALVTQIDRIFARPLRVLGYFRQSVEANWKLYAENTRDPYHAPLLHLFHVSFGIQTPAMEGGSYMDPEGKNNCILVKTNPDDAKDHDLLLEQYKSNDKYRPDIALKDPRIIGTRRSYDDATNLVIMSIFPSLVIAQVENAFQIRHVRPKGPDKFEIFWTYFGFDDADKEEADDKLRLANMIGPAGFISMEDGEAARLVQEAVRTQRGASSVIEMGGRGAVEDQDTLAQEVSLRGFWQYYRKTMGFPGNGGPS